jgi:hypothetical protein
LSRSIPLVAAAPSEPPKLCSTTSFRAPVPAAFAALRAAGSEDPAPLQPANAIATHKLQGKNLMATPHANGGRASKNAVSISLNFRRFHVAHVPGPAYDDFPVEPCAKGSRPIA